jgi:hypothetical protein
LRDLYRLYVGALPPFLFVAGAMQIAVVDAAQRHCELIANLAAKCARLSKLDVMGIGRTPVTDQARLRAHEVSMRFIAFADRLYERDRVPRIGTVCFHSWSASLVVAGLFAFSVGSKSHARSAAIREFYAGGLESASERSNRRTVRSQYAGSAFQALYGWQGDA